MIEEFANKLIEELGLERTRVRGNELFASCPFAFNHETGSDKNPSFSINMDKGVYGCFTCSARGLIEELIAENRHFSIQGAIELLTSWGFDRISIILNRKEAPKENEILPDGLLFYLDKVENDLIELYEGEIDGRDCLVYPVRRVDGKLVGALARSKEDRWHKVMWGMSKKLYLYGEDKVTLEEPVILVEGPGDLLALKKSGFNNVVALMGVSLSSEQVEKLLFLSSDFTVWLDKDEAGRKGMLQCVRRLEKRATMRYVDPWQQLPEGTNDAKDVYEKHGRNKVRSIIKNAKTYLEYSMEV